MTFANTRPREEPHLPRLWLVPVYISRRYSDSWDEEQPWLRERMWPSECEWHATTGGTEELDEDAEFDAVDDAIRWGRERAEVVVVRLGSVIESHYSAGFRPATHYVDGSGWPYPPWPPSTWPDYQGPPEPNWPEWLE
jgi:hypothetical protein